MREESGVTATALPLEESFTTKAAVLLEAVGVWITNEIFPARLIVIPPVIPLSSPASKAPLV